MSWQFLTRGALLLAGLLLARSALAVPVPSGEWRMPRHDVRQSNFSPGTANLANPAVRWRIPLTGALAQASAADVDLDGTEDLLLLVGGRLVAQTLFGKLLWQTPGLGLQSIAGIADLNLDGALDVVAVSPTAVHVLQLATGKVWWNTPSGMYTAIATAAVADFDGDSHLDLATANVGGFSAPVSASTAFWRFVTGTGQQFAATDLPGPDGYFPFGNAQIPLDVDGDSVADLLIYGAERLGAFSGKTGKMLGMTNKLPALFVFQPVQSFQAADGTAPLLVWPANNYGSGGWQQQVGWYVLQLQDGALQVLWQELAEVPSQESSVVVPGSVADLDGDGLGELVASRYVAGKWALRVYDLQSGALLTEVDAQAAGSANPAEGPVLAGVFASQAGGAGLVFGLEAGRAGSVNPALRLARWQRGKGLYDLTDAGKGSWSQANRQPHLDADSRWKQPLVPLQPLGPGQQGDELLWLRDKTADGQADALERSSWQGDQLQVLATKPLGLAPQLPLTVATPAGRWAVVGQADGRVLGLGPQLTLQNDADADGEADLVRQSASSLLLVAGRRTQAAQPSLLVATGPLLAEWDIAGKDPAQPPKQLWQAMPSGGLVTLNLVDVLGQGQRDVLTGSVPANKGVVLRRWSQTGTVLESYTPPGPALRFAFGTAGLLHHDLDGDGADELLLPMAPLLPVAEPLVTTSPLRWNDKKLLWTDPSGCAAVQHYPLALDPTATPPRILQSVGHDRHSCDALTGAMLAHAKGPPASSGTPMLAEHPGPGPGDWTLAGAVNATQAMAGGSAQPLWTQAQNDTADAAGAVVPLASGAAAIQLVPAKATVTARSMATGELLWSQKLTDGKAYPSDQAPSTTATVQRLVGLGALQPGGGPAVLVTNSQGWLHALDAATGQQAWAWPTDGAAGALAVADVDDDGALEVLVGLPQGELVALDGNVAQAPAVVRDVELSGTAPDVDIDEQEDAEAFAASWSPVAGAAGYRAQLLDASAAPVAPAKLVQQPNVRWDAVYLQPGSWYQTSVQSYASVGKDASFSQEARSDGATVVDRSAPQWTDVRCVPACTVGLAQPLQLLGIARDRTRLARVSASLLNPDTALLDKPWLAARYDLALDLAALPAGDHALALRATDLAGNATEVSVAVRVCPAGQIAVQSGCALPAPEPKALGGSRITRRGCSAGRTGGSMLPSSVGWLGVALAGFWAIRRVRRSC